jgi:asparagine synthase (glutamine-hydrolysing)
MMTSRLVHRRPDEEGAWWDPSAGVELGFRRLAISNLGPMGHQPMVSDEWNGAIAFNGKIYNRLDLKRELEADGARFRGTSDTEVILAAAVRWRGPATIRRRWGMFAVALFDSRDRRMLLARDRFGTKPLHYAHDGGRLLFASELNALRAANSSAEIDRAAVAAHIRPGDVPSSRTIYSGVAKVPPAPLSSPTRRGGSMSSVTGTPAPSLSRAALPARTV